MIALALLAVLGLAPQDTGASGPPSAPPGAPSSASGASRVQMGVLVRPDTVTVGEHFTVTVRVRAPRGAEIAFPTGPDSGLSVEAVDPREIERGADTSVTDRTAIYRLVAWDTGGQTAHLGALVITADGTDRRVAIDGDRVYVRSVLPADTAKQKPRPARDILVAGRPWWQWALLALAAALVLALLIWWWRRHRRQRAIVPPIDALAAARGEFDRIDALGLLDAGERGRYVALHADVLRDYLAARVPAAHRALTSGELLEALRADRVLPMDPLSNALTEADLVKFARRPLTSERAREIGREMRAVVEAAERALVAAEEARRAAAAAAAASGSDGAGGDRGDGGALGARRGRGATHPERAA